MTTTKKGRPTPKAPQNQPKAPAVPRELTLQERAMIARRLQRKAARRQSAARRSAMKGIVPLRVAATLDAEGMARRGRARIEAGRYARQDAAEMMAEREAAAAARAAA